MKRLPQKIKSKMSLKNNLSVIIPTINEETSLSALLIALNGQKKVELEIIVADGGSTDKTREIALDHGARFVSSLKGRGRQMNAAAAMVHSDFLLFMHADSLLEGDCFFLANALKEIIAVEKELNHCRVAGHFRLKFKREKEGNDFIYRYMEGKTALNRVNTTNGDQGVLLRREFFHELGGFDQSSHFLEDQKLAESIRSKGKWITLPGGLITSARRFEKEGVWRRYMLMAIIMGMYATGSEAFFRRAQGVYRAQGDTETLLLWPFFAAIWKMMRRDLGFVGSLRTWFLVGRYIRENFWQFFYFIDTVLELEKPLFLNGYDRFLARIMPFLIIDIIFAIGAFFWFMVILGPFFFYLDNCSQGAESFRE